jgi:hypothetical protein
VKRAVLTTSYTHTELKGGRVELLKLWLLLPRCGDGERSFLGVASDMGHAGVVDVITAEEALSRAVARGFTVETHDEWMARIDARGAA